MESRVGAYIPNMQVGLIIIWVFFFLFFPFSFDSSINRDEMECMHHVTCVHIMHEMILVDCI